MLYVAYAGALLWTARELRAAADPWPALAVAAVAVTALALAAVFVRRLRPALHIVAGAHAVIAIVPWYRLAWESDLLFTLLIWQTLLHFPLASGVAILRFTPLTPLPDNLPAGYESALSRSRGLDPAERAVLWVALALGGVAIRLGGFLAMAILVAIAFVVLPLTWLAGRFRKSGDPLATAPRRFRLRRPRRPATQKRSYYTVNTAPFEEPPETD